MALPFWQKAVVKSATNKIIYKTQEFIQMNLLIKNRWLVRIIKYKCICTINVYNFILNP